MDLTILKKKSEDRRRNVRETLSTARTLDRERREARRQERFSMQTGLGAMLLGRFPFLRHTKDFGEDSRYRDEFEAGDETALHDLIAVRGTAAFRSKWVVDAIEDRRLTLLDDPKDSTKTAIRQAEKFLVDVGKALARRGTGTVADHEQDALITRDYKTFRSAFGLLAQSKIRKQYQELVATPGPKAAKARERLGKKFREEYGLTAEEFQYGLDLILTRTPPASVAKRVVARKYDFRNVRTIERAIRRHREQSILPDI